MTDKATLIERFETARDTARIDPTPHNRAAAVEAGRDLSDWIAKNDPPKTSTRQASRAGRKQHAERRAERRSNGR